MSIQIENDVIRLQGACLVEDAEALLLALQDGCRQIDIGSATRLHLAIVQLLIAFRPKVLAMPDNSFIKLHLLPLFQEMPGDEGVNV
jgi:hypothetical protein